MSIVSHIKQLLGLRPSYSTYELSNPRQGRYRPTDARSLVSHNKSWVYVCASRNAETIAGIPLRLYVRGGTRNYYSRRALTTGQKSYISAITRKGADDVEEITEGHPLIDLIDKVNAEDTKSLLIESTVMFQEIIGDAYWYLERGRLGQPVSIWPLISQYTRVVRDSQAKLVGYLYGKSESERVAFDAADVIHFKYPSITDPDYGDSPLVKSFGAATLLEAREEYMRNTYDSGGIPQVGIVVKGRVSQEEKIRLYADWKKRFASKRTGEKAIILEGEITDLKEFGYAPKDVGMEFEQKFSREEICGAFGVPLTMIQLSEASRAGAEAGDYAYMAHTILPKLRRIEQKLNEQLCPRYDDRLFFAFDNPVPDDKVYELEEAKVYVTLGVITINERRAEMGLPPVEWGDEPLKTPAPAWPPAGGPKTIPVPIISGKAVGPLTASERRFSDMLENHMVDIARDVDKRLRDATD
jgi:HK97 family phage portal protein